VTWGLVSAIDRGFYRRVEIEVGLREVVCGKVSIPSGLIVGGVEDRQLGVSFFQLRHRHSIFCFSRAEPENPAQARQGTVTGKKCYANTIYSQPARRYSSRPSSSSSSSPQIQGPGVSRLASQDSQEAVRAGELGRKRKRHQVGMKEKRVQKTSDLPREVNKRNMMGRNGG
jgi:hypothetical protein